MLTFKNTIKNKKVYKKVKSCKIIQFLKVLLILCFAIFIRNNLNAQQSNIWYFPEFAGVNFNTNPPSFIINGQLANGGAASISDNFGNLLFSTNGINVYDKYNTLMDNGTGLNGTFIQFGIPTVIILPFVNDTTKYYVFTTNTLGSVGYWYSIVDISLNNGLGKVIQKNILINSNTSNRMTIKNCNDGYWFLTLEDKLNILKSYKINCNGFDNSPVIDTISNNAFISILGELRCNSTNDYLALSNEVGNYLELYKYDINTGKTYNKIKFKNLTNPRNIEFSSNGKVLYLSDFYLPTMPRIYQYNLTNFDSLSIENSKIVIDSAYNILNPFNKCLQLGPNGKIFAASLTDSFFYVINNPNVIGLGCNILKSNLPCINFNRPFTRFGTTLPYFVPSLITNQNTQITYTVRNDCRTVDFTGKTYIKGNNLSFKWKFTPTDSITQVIPSGACPAAPCSGDTTFATTSFTFPPGIDTFYISLTVTSDTVCGLGRAGKMVVVKPPPPIANFGSITTCNNLTAAFTDSSLLNFNPSITHQYAYKLATAPASTYTNFSILPSPTFTFPAYDSFDVRLIVKSALSCVQEDTFVKRIFLQPKPTANFNSTNNCGSLTANFTNTSTIAVGSIAQHRWFLNGVLINSTPTFNYTFANYGNYIIKYVAESAAGCVSDTAMQTITIKDKPTATLTYNNNACANTNFTIIANNTVSNATILNQNCFINGVVQSSNANTLTANLNAGTYTLQYISSTNQGCVSDTATKIIVVQSKPIVNFTTTNGCVNDALTFTNTTTNAIGNPLNFQWQINNINESNATTLTKAFTTGGNYNILLKATTSNGCSDSIQKIISIETKPVANFIYDSACLQKPVLFTNTSTNTFGTITNFNWNFDNGQTATTPSATTTFTSERNYAVSLQITTANGCSGSITKTIPIQAVQIIATSDTTIAANQPLQLQVTGAATYSWSPSFGLNNPSIANPIAILQQAQLYQVQGITTAGCVGYANVLVQVYKDKGLYIPTIFTPNNDGINDTWKIICSGVQKLNYIKVYNRWGQLVHQQNNCTTAWNGNYNGKPLSVGAYVYLYEAIDFTNTKINGKGTVVVAR